MRVIVTGGAGFIGSHLCDALVGRGDEVHVVDDLSSGKREHVPARASLHVRDVRDGLADLVDRVHPDAIAHLAAQVDVRVSVAEPVRDASVNVVGTVNVLEAARAAGARVVFASSGGAVYGECERPAREDDPRQPLSPYGASKLAGEEYLASFARLHGSAHVSLRLGNVYGPRQDPHGEAGVVAIFLGRLRDGEPCRIFGDGSQTRDYVFVADVVAALTSALDGKGAGIYNVGTGVGTSVLELYEACRVAAGSVARAVHGPARAGELGRSVLDPALAEHCLGFRATTTLADGIARTWSSLQD